LENVCQNSKVVGFRAPYLKAPNYLFKILENLGFEYDSSVKSSKSLKVYQTKQNKIQEFHPSEFSAFFRLPLCNSLLRKRIFKKELVILYFHTWEAINMKNLAFTQINLFNFFKNFQLRPDRWFNTGNCFTSRFISFIKESISKKAEFITLKQLCREKY
jgi:hypothetical protein